MLIPDRATTEIAAAVTSTWERSVERNCRMMNWEIPQVEDDLLEYSVASLKQDSVGPRQSGEVDGWALKSRDCVYMNWPRPSFPPIAALWLQSIDRWDLQMKNRLLLVE